MSGIFGSHTLLDQRLKDPNRVFGQEEQIEIVKQCVSMGRKEAIQAIGRDCIAVIGNTGAGKSTFVNALYGCTMKSRGKGTRREVYVGWWNTQTPIGHSRNSRFSETFLPKMVPIPDQSYCLIDCPGFLDNRGSEISLSNALNIRTMMHKASRVGVLLLIDQHSIQADRGTGFASSIEYLKQLFGSEQKVRQNRQGILIGISKIAPSGSQSFSLEDVKHLFQHHPNELIQELADRVFTFDPLDARLEGGWSLSTIRGALRNLRWITSPKELFKIPLGSKEEALLYSIANKTKTIASDAFRNKKYDQAIKAATNLKELRVVVDNSIERHVASVNQEIVRLIESLIGEFHNHCREGLFRQARKELLEIERFVKRFDSEIQGHFSFQSYHQEIEKSIDHQMQREEEIRNLEEQVRRPRELTSELRQRIQRARQQQRDSYNEREAHHRRAMARITDTSASEYTRHQRAIRRAQRQLNSTLSRLERIERSANRAHLLRERLHGCDNRLLELSRAKGSVKAIITSKRNSIRDLESELARARQDLKGYTSENLSPIQRSMRMEQLRRFGWRCIERANNTYRYTLLKAPVIVAPIDSLVSFGAYPMEIAQQMLSVGLKILQGTAEFPLRAISVIGDRPTIYQRLSPHLPTRESAMRVAHRVYEVVIPQTQDEVVKVVSYLVNSFVVLMWIGLYKYIESTQSKEGASA